MIDLWNNQLTARVTWKSSKQREKGKEEKRDISYSDPFENISN